MSTLETLTELTCELISRPSITPADAGCQQFLGARLETLGFHIESMRHGEVDNLWAVRDRGGPLLMFAGHTDVVPTGEHSAWRHDPFSPLIEEGLLYGRGAADMKGSLAAMLVSVEQFVKIHPESGSIAFLITSDEEGPALDGTVKVVESLRQRKLKCDYCVIGEPSSTAEVGDVIRVGRRGSLNGRLKINGIQGHVAYPQLALNPIHAALPMLSRLTAEHWDEGNADFPPTSFQISNIASGTGASNVIPGQMTVDFNLRFSTAQTSDGLKDRIEQLCAQDQLDHHIDWVVSGQPFLTPQGQLLECVDRSVSAIQGFVPEHSTGGGTSDGRFIAALGCELIELGPVNDSIHQVNEYVKLADLVKLSDIYLQLMNRLLVTHA
jgi:succinyl-diaminopimelate desuccinylase